MNCTPDHNSVNSLLSFLSPNWCEGVYKNSSPQASESAMLNTPPGYEEEVLNTTTVEQSEREQSFGIVHNDTEERDFLTDDRITTVVDTKLCHAQNFCISPVSSYHSELLDSDSAGVCTTAENQPEYIVPTIVEKTQSEDPMYKNFIENSAEQCETIVDKFETVGFECHICHKRYKSISELQWHLLVNHDLSSVFNLMCTDKNNLEKSINNVLQICSMLE
jgi:hypothetical protein